MKLGIWVSSCEGDVQLFSSKEAARRWITANTSDFQCDTEKQEEIDEFMEDLYELALDDGEVHNF